MKQSHEIVKLFKITEFRADTNTQAPWPQEKIPFTRSHCFTLSSGKKHSMLVFIFSMRLCKLNGCLFEIDIQGSDNLIREIENGFYQSIPLGHPFVTSCYFFTSLSSQNLIQIFSKLRLSLHRPLAKLRIKNEIKTRKSKMRYHLLIF